MNVSGLKIDFIAAACKYSGTVFATPLYPLWCIFTDKTSCEWVFVQEDGPLNSSSSSWCTFTTVKPCVKTHHSLISRPSILRLFSFCIKMAGCFERSGSVPRVCNQTRLDQMADCLLVWKKKQKKQNVSLIAITLNHRSFIRHELGNRDDVDGETPVCHSRCWSGPSSWHAKMESGDVPFQRPRLIRCTCWSPLAPPPPPKRPPAL